MFYVPPHVTASGDEIGLYQVLSGPVLERPDADANLPRGISGRDQTTSGHAPDHALNRCPPDTVAGTVHPAVSSSRNRT